MRTTQSSSSLPSLSAHSYSCGPRPQLSRHPSAVHPAMAHFNWLPRARLSVRMSWASAAPLHRQTRDEFPLEARRNASRQFNMLDDSVAATQFTNNLFFILSLLGGRGKRLRTKEVRTRKKGIIYSRTLFMASYFCCSPSILSPRFPALSSV